MLRYFIIFLMICLFLSSCNNGSLIEEEFDDFGGGEVMQEKATEDVEPPSVNENVQATEETNNVPVVELPSINENVQKAKSSYSDTWTCVKTASATVGFALDNNPRANDERGNLMLCRILQIYDDGRLEMINYANNERDFCNKRIVEILDERKSDGWTCSKDQ